VVGVEGSRGTLIEKLSPSLIYTALLRWKIHGERGTKAHPYGTTPSPSPHNSLPHPT